MSPGVRRVLSWPAVVVLSLGSALLVTVSLGPMAQEIGAASIVVWAATAFVGFLQCLLIAELGSRYPTKVGGLPAYTHEALKHLSPLFGAAAAWAYWVAWIPGVAVHLTLAATYVKAAFWPEASVLALTLALVTTVYALNYFGLRFSVWTSAILSACALAPLAVILSAPLYQTSVWQNARFSPLFPHGEALSIPGLLLAAKWMFVAVWSSYGGEMAAASFGELRDPERDIPKAMGGAAAGTLLAFVLTPLVLVGITGAEAMAADPYVVFLTAARGVFGASGAAIISVMLIAALVLGAQLFIISSSRALYQMSVDGLTIPSYRRLNQFGVPVGSVGWDAIVTFSMIAIFRDDVVEVVAAANVGYLVVMAMLPAAYVMARRRERTAPWSLPSVMTPIAGLIALFNVLLLVVGGPQWGLKVLVVGVLLVAAGAPFYVFRRAPAELSPAGDAGRIGA
jgi:amino acid transporter